MTTWCMTTAGVSNFSFWRRLMACTWAFGRAFGMGSTGSTGTGAFRCMVGARHCRRWRWRVRGRATHLGMLFTANRLPRRAWGPATLTRRSRRVHCSSWLADQATNWTRGPSCPRPPDNPAWALHRYLGEFRNRVASSTALSRGLIIRIVTAAGCRGPDLLAVPSAATVRCPFGM